MSRIKKLFVILSLFFIPTFAFCANIRLSLPTLSVNNQVLLPVDSEIGQIVQSNETSFHSFLAEAISSEFGYEWLETYVHPDSRASIANVFSSFLSENLPVKNFIMSSLSENGDSSVSISVRFGTKDSDPVASFVVDSSYIVALSVKKSL